jgi:hypothetical protein|uniref:Uncharacterized protein n=1 Tax=viral metagenome TaxID=1070528 RepID=A0A6C0BEN3_9ZZZZ
METLIEKMLNMFLKMYNSTYHTKGSFFDGIDEKDPFTTNHKMELFYQYIEEHKDLLKIDKKYINVYKSENKDSLCNDINKDVYVIVRKNVSSEYISLSYINLLITGINKYNHKEEWKIIKL